MSENESIMVIIKRKWPIAALALFAILCLAAPLLANSNQSPSKPPVFQKSTLIIQRADGQQIPYNVEIAAREDQSEYGLMFRKTLPPNTGMIFLVKPEHEMVMWMKNTILPLDMLFVGHDGSIVKIITHAVPFDLTPLRSGDPVKAVIEINGGEADAQNIKTGDKVLFSGFSQPPTGN